MITATVTGNLGKPAELRDTKAGPVCSFSVASNRKNKGEDETTWIRCSLFGKRGESLAQYLTKGTKVAVSGELSTHEYQNKTYLELRVSDLDLMGGGDRSGSTRRNDPEPDQYAPPDGGGDGPDDDMGDIPFAPLPNI